MLNIGRLRLGAADYYVGEIALSPDDYYLGHGEASGRWVGSLAEEMGLRGEVDPEHFRALLDGRHPLTGEQLVALPPTKADRISVAAEDEWLTVKEASAQLGVSTRFVRRLLAKSELVGEKALSSDTGRLGWRIQRGHVNVYAVSHKSAKRRPGFDLTLRPPKSVSVLWALADPEHRAAIRQVHREAVDEVVRYCENQASMARAKGSRVQTAGLVAAAFDHRTSRAGDPLLHTHVVVANMTLTVADSWRALDGRLLFDHGLSGGYLYQAHLRHLLTERLGVAWGPVVNGTADVAGVPDAVIDQFSQRRHEIEEMLAESGYTSARARQTATLATRSAKDGGVSPDTLVNAWRERSAALGFGDQAVEQCFDRPPVPGRKVDDLYRYLAGPFGLTERASTFTRRDVVQGLAAALGASATAEEVERHSDRFLASERVVILAGPTSGRNSRVVVGVDNRRIRTGGTAVFSTPELVEKESGLLRWAEQNAAAGVDAVATPHAVDQVLALRPELSDEQVAMVRAVCSSSRTIQPVVGRPGSGKTYATAACVEAFNSSGTPVFGCAVSATAAAELEATVGFERLVGRPAQTIASLLAELEVRGERLAQGTALVIDEASMVGTRDLARLAGHVTRAGGTIKLIGDPDQHTSVDTGGVFKALAARNRGDLVKLVENRRQVDPGERVAIKEYREGRIEEALSHYDASGKIVRQANAAETYDALVRDWWADRQAGSTSPMLAGTNTARRALNARARALLKTEGVLSGDALVIHKREFMVGDEVVARRNDRSLHQPGRSEFVKNGSVGRVTVVDPQRGEIKVDFTRVGRVLLPRDYLTAGHIEHAYARTTYGVQGATLDRARYHPTDVSRFEEGYVAITRATESTKLYVVEGDVDVDDEADHYAVESVETGLATVADALGRRSDKQLAIDTDPRAVEAGRLAQALTLRALHERRYQVDAVLANQPPSVADQLAEAKRASASLQARRSLLHHGKAGWKPNSRRGFSQALASLDQAIEHANRHVAALEAEQSDHHAFTIEHHQEFAERELVGLATSTRRLKLRLAAVANPPSAIVEVLGPRPLGQRERLRWDRAVESIAVYVDEGHRRMSESASSISEVLGPRPSDPAARFDYDCVAKAVRAARTPDRPVGRSLGLG